MTIFKIYQKNKDELLIHTATDLMVAASVSAASSLGSRLLVKAEGEAEPSEMGSLTYLRRVKPASIERGLQSSRVADRLPCESRRIEQKLRFVNTDLYLRMKLSDVERTL